MITIFTPTFNRATLLPRLFDSLTHQSCKDFEWLRVDDGSTDHTECLIHEMIQNADFPIRYYYHPNSGKHVAHNLGVRMAHGDLFFCVDSDDFLSHDRVIEQIIHTWKYIKHDEQCVGIISLKCLLDGTLLGTPFPALQNTSPFDLTHTLHCPGERNYILGTYLLRKVPYPVLAGEIFFPDSFIIDNLSAQFTMFLRNYKDICCEYQADGLSSHFPKLMKNNPKGFCLANRQTIDLHKRLLPRLGAIFRYWAFFFLSREPDFHYSGKYPAAVFLCRIPGWFLAQYYRIRLR